MRRLVHTPAALGLVVLMVIGSVLLWIGIPLGWLYVVSHIFNSSQPTLTAYLLILVGIPTSMAVMAKALGRLQAMYGDVMGERQPRFRAPWMRSARGERESGRPLSVLDVIMIVSVLVAGLILLVWFLFFAGSSLPGT